MKLLHIIISISCIITMSKLNSAGFAPGQREAESKKAALAAELGISLEELEQQQQALNAYVAPDKPQTTVERETKGEEALASQAGISVERLMEQRREKLAREEQEEIEKLVKKQEELALREQQRRTAQAAVPVAPVVFPSSGPELKRIGATTEPPAEYVPGVTPPASASTLSEEELKELGISPEQKEVQAKILEDIKTGPIKPAVRKLLDQYKDIPILVKNTRFGFGASVRAKAQKVAGEFLKALEESLAQPNKAAIEKAIVAAYTAAIAKAELPKDFGDLGTLEGAYVHWTKLIDELHKLIPAVDINKLIP